MAMSAIFNVANPENALLFVLCDKWTYNKYNLLSPEFDDLYFVLNLIEIEFEEQTWRFIRFSLAALSQQIT